MGQRQNETEPEWGNDCALKFPAGKTPRFVYGRFSNIVTCPGAPLITPNDRTFTLEQQPGIPCLWIHHAGAWRVSFEFDVFVPESHFFITHIPTGDLYFNDHEPGYIDEGFVFHNEQAACIGVQQGISGIGIVTWRLETLDIMKAMNMEVANNLFMEMRPLDNGSRVYKYCRIQDATNVKIKYNP